MRLFRAVADHPGLKLMSLFLAWGLWLAFREDQEETRALTLEVVPQASPDSNVEGTMLTQRVDVRIRGARRDIETLATGPRHLVAPIAGSDMDVDQFSVVKQLRARDLRVPPPIPAGALRVLSMEPETIGVKIRKFENRPLQLAPLEFPPESETRVKIETRKLPEQVWVKAPAETLRNTLNLRMVVDRDQLLHLIDRMDDAIRTTVTVALHVHPDQREQITLLETKSLEAVLELVRVDTQPVIVPLAIYRDVAADAPSLAVTLAPANKPWVYLGVEPSVKITLRGSRESLQSLEGRRVQAYLLVSDVPAGATSANLPLHVADLPPGVALDDGEYSVAVEVAR